MRISDWSSDVCSSDLLATKQPCSYRPGRAPVEIRLAEPSREHCQQEAEKETWQNPIMHQESMKQTRIGLRLRKRTEAPPPRDDTPCSPVHCPKAHAPADQEHTPKPHKPGKTSGTG